MTASAIERDRRGDTGSWPWRSLRIDFGTFEAFHAWHSSRAKPPRIVRWFACFARGEPETASS